jgi:hypothetical protein
MKKILKKLLTNKSMRNAQALAAVVLVSSVTFNAWA